MLPRTIQRIQNLARLPIEPVTIKQLLGRSANLTEEGHIQHALWMREQVPIRLAHRLAGFLELPYVVFCNTRFHEAFRLFDSSLQGFESVKPFRNMDDVTEFAEAIRTAHQEHSEVINMMQEGYAELQELLDNIDLDAFLNQTFTTRIGNRMLAEHFLALHDALVSGTGECTGVVQRRCCPADVVKDLSKRLGTIFFDVYGVRPEIIVEGELDVEMSFITGHLSFMLQEILKNAIRATIETHMHSGEPLPPVSVEIMKGSFDVTLKVSDQGGGMKPEKLKELWRYGATSANDSDSLTGGGRWTGYGSSRKTSCRSVAGYGFGLPLSRVYAKYFGGGMVIQSMHGYGSDVYLNINHLGDSLEARESHTNKNYVVEAPRRPSTINHQSSIHVPI